MEYYAAVTGVKKKKKERIRDLSTCDQDIFFKKIFLKKQCKKNIWKSTFCVRKGGTRYIHRHLLILKEWKNKPKTNKNDHL